MEPHPSHSSLTTHILIIILFYIIVLHLLFFQKKKSVTIDEWKILLLLTFKIMKMMFSSALGLFILVGSLVTFASSFPIQPSPTIIIRPPPLLFVPKLSVTNVNSLPVQSTANNNHGRLGVRHLMTVDPTNNTSQQATTTTTKTKKTANKKNNKGTNRKLQRDDSRNQSNTKHKVINQKMLQLNSAKEILDYFIAQGGAKTFAGGGTFNSVNYSTIVHRFAKFVLQSNDETGRKVLLSDPRFAVLLSSLTEAIVQSTSPSEKMSFANRELANVGWAIAKLRLTPPLSVLPITRTSNTNNNNQVDDSTDSNNAINYVTMEDRNHQLLTTATKLKKEVLEAVKQQRNSGSNEVLENTWIPTTSLLSGMIMDSISSRALDIVHKFNTQEIANLLYAFASAERAEDEFFSKLIQQFIRSVERQKKNNTSKYNNKKQPRPQEFSISVWAFASAGLRGQSQIEFVNYFANSISGEKSSNYEQEFVKAFKPQELSNTAWGVATLLSKRNNSSNDQDLNDQSLDLYKKENEGAVTLFRWVAKSLQERIEFFKPQEISNTIWAFATVGFGASLSINNVNNEVILGLDQPDDDRRLVQNTLEVVAKNAVKRLHSFRPQELNNLSWGFCRLGHYDKNYAAHRELMEGIGKEILRRNHQFSPQDTGTTMWSFATMEYFDEDVYRAACSRLSLQRCRHFKPQELSNTVWALSTAGFFPEHLNAFDTTLVHNSIRPSASQIKGKTVTECFAAVTTELIRRPEEFKLQEIKDTLWSLSKAGVRHPVAFRKIAEHLVASDDDYESGKTGRGLDSISPQGLGNLVWSYAKQGQIAADVSVNTNGRLAVYESILLDVGETLLNRLFLAIAEKCMDDGLENYTPQDLSNMCWAFATLGMLHQSFFEAVYIEVQKRLSTFKSKASMENIVIADSIRFKGQEIANLIWSFATLDAPANNMLELFTPYILSKCRNKVGDYSVQSIAAFFKRMELANLAWSCAVMEQYPPQLMPLIYTALFGSKNDNDPVLLTSIYNDDGLQKQAIMALLYVQTAMDMEAPQLGLSLPINFPAQWRGSDHIQIEPSVSTKDDDSSTLDLKTSRLQNDVSRAFERVGYSHVLEHVIRTDEIHSIHGIRLSSEVLEFLSIDIANLSDLVGIEVDGPGHFVNIIDDESNEKNIRSRAEGVTELWRHSPKQFNGSTSLKHRLLSQLGWKIAHVPFWEWHQIENKINQEMYCRELLETIHKRK